MTKQKILTGLLIFVIFSLLLIVVAGSLSKQNSNNVPLPPSDPNSDLVLYYGDTCPHCHELFVWMDAQKISDKIKLQRKEVYEDQRNALELSNVARKCGLDPNSVGVPFLYAKGQCLIGTPDIEKYMTDEISKESTSTPTEAQTK